MRYRHFQRTVLQTQNILIIYNWHELFKKRARKFLITILMPWGLLIGDKSHLIITLNYKNDHFPSVFDKSLAPVAMATTEKCQNAHEWTPKVESFNMIPYLPWSDTDLIKWLILSHIVNRLRICSIVIFNGLYFRPKIF